MREPPADISADFNNPSAPGMGRRRCRDRQSLSAFPEWHCGQADLGVARAAKVGGPRLCTSPGCDEKLERSQGGGFKGTGAVWHPPAHRGSHARYGQRRCGLPWCLARPVLEPRGHSLSSLIRGLVLAPCRGFNTLVRATQACIDSHTPQRPHPSPPHIRAPPHHLLHHHHQAHHHHRRGRPPGLWLPIHTNASFVSESWPPHASRWP